MIDLGAGDGRFAVGGSFRSYTGFEYDPKVKQAPLPKRAKVVTRDALSADGAFDCAIGNPPFMRVQDLSENWRAAARTRISQEAGIDPGRLANLYVYFLWLALLRTKRDGLVAIVVPSDWTWKPSARPLRTFIRINGWSIDTYDLPHPLGFRTKTRVNAGITVIDKRRPFEGQISHRLKDAGEKSVADSRGASSTPWVFLPERGRVYSFRGLSPGSRQAFVLTDAERKCAGISRREVYPAVASLRPLQQEAAALDRRTFEKVYVKGGARCWLLKTNLEILSASTMAWLKAIPQAVRRNSTCRNRPTWYRYNPPPAPLLLYSNTFRGASRPKIVENKVRARNLGSVHGILGMAGNRETRKLLQHLRGLDFLRGTVPWTGGLRRVEVGQMNALLSAFYSTSISTGSQHG